MRDSEIHWREPAKHEMSLLVRAIDVPDERMDAYKAQLEGILVAETEAPILGLYLRPNTACEKSAKRQNGILSVGRYEDLDGVPVEIFLFSEDGYLNYLDIIKYDKSEKFILPPWDVDVVFQIEERSR